MTDPEARGPGDPDREDMLALVAGESEALDRLMARHGLPVFHFLVRMVGHDADAADLAQETFARLYQTRDRYRPDRPFGSWLYTLAANLARNHLRWRNRHPAESLDQPAAEDAPPLREAMPGTIENPAEQIAGAELKDAVRRAITHLPPALREALVLVEFEDHSVRETAEILAIPPRTVESRLFHARRLLRDRLRRWLSPAQPRPRPCPSATGD